MRKACVLGGLMALLATPAWAEMKIAVLNYQAALLESEAAKQYAVEAEKKFGPQLNKLKALEAEAKKIQERLTSTTEKLSQSDREKMELDFKQKARDYQQQVKSLNESKAESDREMLEKLKPKLDQAVEATLKDGAYDLVIERSAVVDVKPDFDITKNVIQKMNK